MIVRLTWQECAEATREGCQRRLRRLARDRTDRYGWDHSRDEWGSDIEATAAEIAFAKALGHYWAPSDQPDYDGDVGAYQVRSSTRPDAKLIVYPDDRDDHVFALVVGRIPEFRIVGTIAGADAKQDEWSAGARLRVPAYLVPQDALGSLMELAA